MGSFNKKAWMQAVRLLHDQVVIRPASKRMPSWTAIQKATKCNGFIRYTWDVLATLGVISLNDSKTQYIWDEESCPLCQDNYLAIYELSKERAYEEQGLSYTPTKKLVSGYVNDTPSGLCVDKPKPKVREWTLERESILIAKVELGNWPASAARSLIKEQMPEAEAFEEEDNVLMVYKFGEFKLVSHE